MANYVYTYQNTEFTSSNYYILSFDVNFGNSWFVFGHDPNLTSLDGLFISNNKIRLYVKGSLVDEQIITPFDGTVTLGIIRQGDKFSLHYGNNELYLTDRLSWNTVGTYNESTVSSTSFLADNFILQPLVVTDITPSTDDYDGSVYGSDLHLEVEDDHLNLVDYGMLPNGAIGSGKVLVDNVPLSSSDLELELEMKYNNVRFERLNNLTGQIQMRVFEDILSSDTAKEYANVLCSPMPVKNAKTIFTRHSEEGILYFVEEDKLDDITPTYLCNGYAQYKGGVQITTETGIQLFNLDNAHSPVFVGNNLVRAEFHRRSGYIRLSRYDETSNEWCTVNTLKLKNNPQLNLVEYNDDYCELNFGKTTWKFYRGRPFIICNHSEDDFRVLKLVDRVYCENNENNRVLGFIEEHDTMNSIFTPQLSIQQFKQDLHIGENIRADNFKLYGVDSNGYLNDNPNGSIEVVDLNDEKAIKVNKTSGKVALNFPSYSHYVKRVGDTFSLLLDNVLTDSETSITIKARGFDDRGAVPIYESIQYGIWEQSKGASVYNCLATIDGTLAENDVSTCENYIMPSNKPTTEFANHIKVTFTDCPSEVKYLDFVVILNGITASETIIKNIMYYEGDALLNHEVDTSQVYAEQTEIQFTKTYYANLYNDDENCGLGIGRPSQHKIGLRYIYADDETVFIPYMKKASEWDKPSQVFLEYLNAKRQIVDIDWEN